MMRIALGRRADGESVTSIARGLTHKTAGGAERPATPAREPHPDKAKIVYCKGPLPSAVGCGGGVFGPGYCPAASGWCFQRVLGVTLAGTGGNRRSRW